MNLTKIRYFVEVARCGSFSEAARRLYTAQPNLSRQIAQMEEELGFALFQRTRRSVKLTEAGEYLYHQLKELPDQLDHIFAEGRELAGKRADVISIGVLEAQDLNQVLSCRLNQAAQSMPGLEFTLERNSYSNLRSGLRSGHYDIIITLDFDVVDETDLELALLYAKEPAVAMHCDHPLAKNQNVTLSELRDQSFVVISREESPGGYRKLMDSCEKAGFVPKVVREPRSLESLLLCVEMGMGIAMLDRNTRLELSPHIVTIPQNAPPMEVVAVIRKDEERPVVRNVVQLLEENGKTASPC